jgi:hypothetical protein
MTEDTCVVTPTIRNPEFVREYVANAREHGHADRLYFVLVTEEFCDTDGMREMLDDLGVSGRVFAGEDRTEWFHEQGVSEYADLIPAKSHAQTSFGLLYLWANDFEYGVFLDDDTRPHPAYDFFGGHYDTLAREGAVESRSSDTNWVNVLDGVADLYPRGYPYSAMDETTEYGHTEAAPVAASQGLWTDVPDLDAVRILADGDLEGQSSVRLEREDYLEDGREPEFAVAEGDYTTVCSMNLAFRREVVPAFYQLPMDDNEWGVGRFDDIWSGVLLKRACDVLGYRLLTGAPLCVHEKAPRSTFGDLRAEAPALELNEHLWRIVDDAGEDAESFREAFAAMADALAAADTDLGNDDFLSYVATSMHRWLDCLAALSAPRVPADD